MENIKAVVFDMDGVLRIGNQLIRGAETILKDLQKRGIKSMIVTNECRYTADELREELDELGLSLPETYPIYTAGMAARDYLSEKFTRFPDTLFQIGIVGESGYISNVKYTVFL